MRLAAISVFLVLAGCASAPLPQADTDLPGAFAGGVVYLQVSVNGAAPVWMELDDGTSPSVIDLNYAKNLGLALKPGAGAGTGFGTQKVRFFTTNADITTGQATRTHVDFSATSMNGVKGPDGQPLAGVIGYSFLKDRILVLDYPRHEIRFVAQTPPCACDIRFTLDNDIPSIPVTVAGHPLTALVDTGGAYELLLTPPAAQAAGLQAYMDEAAPVTGYGYAGAQSVKIGSAPDVTVGTIRKVDPATVYSTFGTAPLKAQAALGNQFLKDYKVTLNYRARTVRFES